MPWCTLDNGRRLWYEDQGQGQPLVLVHGWCMSSAVWRFQLESLGDRFRVIAPDLRGHGQSEAAGEGHDFPGFAADLQALFFHLDLHGALLAGWSLGAQVALLAYERLRERLSGLVLVSGTPRFTSSEDFAPGLDATELAGMVVRVRRNLARAREGFMADMFAPGERDDHELDQRIGQVLAAILLPEKSVAVQGLAALAEADMRGVLPAIDLPTLIINGDQDRICLPGASAYMARWIQPSTHVVLDGCGHAPFLTRSTDFNDSITGFSRRIFAQGR
ncbi:MAG: alpha/beta fold hydrolase [Desulfuromonadales bacterium]|nr:alpha/beta fold hydrolase [Desulfuromonadales bacterium]